MIEFEFVLRPHLPRLAWLARMERGSQHVRVVHGRDVETTPDFFCEAAWPAPFEAGGFLEAALMSGSGARRESSAVVFTTASHTLERLHLLHSGDVLLVSNSLPFCLAEAGDGPDLAYPFYLHDLSGVTRGVRRAPRVIPTRGGRKVELVYYTHLRVTPDLRLERLPKPAPPQFESFAHYHGWLVATAQALADNVTSPARRTRYRTVATVSSGYDSPACAVIAREAGCREALTITRAREEVYGGLDDSGEAIGRVLGLQVEVFEQSTYRDLDGFPEAEFLAGGTGGGDVVMAAMEKALGGALLFTGFLGDTVWGRAAPDPVHSRDLVFRYPAGIALHEFRLRVGFLHLPLPQSHQRSHPSLHRITISPEMAPWTLGTDYDRPIARRIVESAGVPRDWFGHRKKAVTQPLFRDSDVEAYLSPASRADFEQFLREVPMPDTREQRRLARLHRAHLLNRRISAALVRRLGLRPSHPLATIRVSDHHARPWSKAFYLFHWGVDKLLPRYAGVGPGELHGP